MYPHDEICSKNHWRITCSAVGMLYTGPGEHVVEGEIACCSKSPKTGSGRRQNRCGSPQGFSAVQHGNIILLLENEAIV